MGFLRGMITVFNRKSGKISIRKSFGLTPEEEARGVYELGEGVTGQVVETGTPVRIPRVSAEPTFLNRTRSRPPTPDLSFVCVPIVFRHEVLGTISADRPAGEAAGLDRDVETLSIVASMIGQAVEIYRMEHEATYALERENRRLRDALKERYRPSNILGNAKPMQQMYAAMEKVARTRTTVLILGESGVGKELVANAIHFSSPRADGPLVKFNCAALPETVVESELFGHERGAFTGAVASRKGRFEEADGGTLFIDEVGEVSPTVQAKLLRVLQEKCFERVGGSTVISVDIRVITATNQNLEALVERGLFREDLYYRLNVFPIVVPPLRDRGQDIILLADHFVEKFSKQNRKSVKRFSAAALDMLVRYHWPGNVRELENVIERAVLLSDDEVIHGYMLPPSLQTADHSAGAKQSLDSKLAAVESEILVEALRLSGGNKAQAARDLGLTERVITSRLKKHGIDHKGFSRKR